MPNILSIDENTYQIDFGFVRCFLLLGTEKALLVDTGAEPCDLKEMIQEVTSLPVELINTHSDPDHIANNNQFDWCYMHPSEAMVYHNIFHNTGKIIPVYENDVIELGNRSISILHIPGHTPGSIGLLDSKKRFLIGGDAIQDGEVFLFGLHRDFPSYIDGLRHVQERISEFDVVFASHGTLQVPSTIVSEIIEDALLVQQGKCSPIIKEVHGNPVVAYQSEHVTFLLPEKES